MKAAVFHGPKQPLTIEEVEIDEPQDREVLVRTVASGVCHSDLHFVDGYYSFPAPAVLGRPSLGRGVRGLPAVHPRRVVGRLRAVPLLALPRLPVAALLTPSLLALRRLLAPCLLPLLAVPAALLAVPRLVLPRGLLRRRRVVGRVPRA